ncbi:PspC domain-containing protein [Streptomyces sp. WMMC897]|uniref:PspC domain-containing protein n=1 Tax=Streptomyces sp. WMMC897 TaxID=3014782 RepID=UPI0022B60F11|nr:PspC domain-containing protein [Streptomyces sp. WMMC897]MCZ7417106.1 PspC domain-containing protein [Streptomyces sp. WMMC897]
MVSDEDGQAGLRSAPGPGSGTADGPGSGAGGPGASGADGGRPTRPERSRRTKVVAGVCGGIARHYDVDPVILRVPLAVLSAIGGLGLLLYGFAWLLLPLEGEDENEAKRLLSGRVEGPGLAAVLFTLAGSGLMLSSLGNNGRSMSFSILVLAAVAAGVHWSQRRRRQDAPREAEPGHPDAGPQAPPEAQAPPVPNAPSWWREPLTKDPNAQDTGYLWGPADAYPQGREPTPAGGVPTAGHGAHPWPGLPPGSRPPGSGPPGSGPLDPFRPPGSGLPGSGPPLRRGWRGWRLGWAIVPAAALAGWIGVAANWDGDSLSTALVTGLACALAVLGLGLAVGSFVGRVGAGTVMVAVMTAGLLAGSAALPEDLSTSWSSTRWAPATAADVRPAYDLGSGEGVLDLSGLDLAEDQTVSSEVSAGVGELRVIVPENARLVLDLDIVVGEYRLTGGSFDGDGGGNGGGVGLTETVTVEPRGDAEPRGTIRLGVDLVLGEVVVDQAIVEPAPAPQPPDEPADASAEQALGRPDREGARL